MNIFKKIGAGLLLGLACAVAQANPFVSPDQAHGKLVLSVKRSAENIYPVEIVAVNGQEVPNRSTAVSMAPGEYELKLRLEGTVNLEDLPGITPRRAPTETSLRIKVEEGKTYYLGYQYDDGTWKAVVWKTKPSRA